MILPMTSQGRAVAKVLFAVFKLAHMGSLARVRSHVDLEGRALDEALSAAQLLTDVGSLVCVDAEVSGEVRSTAECFGAVEHVAFVGFALVLLCFNVNQFKNVHGVVCVW